MKPRLFVGSSVESLKIAHAIQQNLEYDATVVPWDQTSKGSFSFLDALEVETKKADFAVFIFMPDDLVTKRGTQYRAVRDNVLFELGLFLAALGKHKGLLGTDRCFVLVPRGKKKVQLPSDLQGLDPLTYGPPRNPADIRAALGPACTTISDRMSKLGVISAADEQSLIFYRNRRDLPSLEDQLKGVRELWLTFFTGSVVNAGYDYDIFFRDRRVRLILPHPFYSAFRDLTKFFKQPNSRMQRDVLDLTLKATKDGVKVRWYKGPLPSSLIISNPRSSAKSWAKVEILVPFGDTVKRPSFKIKHGINGKVLSEIVHSFEELWRQSKEQERVRSR